VGGGVAAKDGDAGDDGGVTGWLDADEFDGSVPLESVAGGMGKVVRC
jgi:hypothetical protein